MSLLHRAWRRVPAPVRRSLKSVPGTARLRDRSYGAPSGPAPPPGAPRPVVYLPTWLEWDVMRQRPQYLLEAMARSGHEVWFVDPRLPHGRDAGDGIHLVPSLGPVPGANVILYTHFAPTRGLVERFVDPVVVYDVLDDLTIYEDAERGVPEAATTRHHHRALIQAADAVIVSNPVLARRHRPERADLLLVENGVDLGRFTPDGPVARELAGPAPVAGFHGAVAPWLDLPLLEEVARSRPGARFVLVGPVDPGAGDLSGLLALANVTHLPEQPSDRIPEFVRGFSAGLIPFVVDRMTEGVTPLKMYEYLASEVPVVATPLPACVEHPHVATAADPEGFAAALDRALALGPGERSGLRDAAAAASWDRRISPLLERLEGLGLRFVP